jgi:hypothetical protein
MQKCFALVALGASLMRLYGRQTSQAELLKFAGKSTTEGAL